MQPTPTQAKLTDARDRLSELDPGKRAIVSHVRAFHEINKNALRGFMVELTNPASPGAQGHVGNAASVCVSLIQSTAGAHFTSSKAFLDTLEVSPEYLEALPLVEKLEADISALEAQDAAERADLTKRQRAHADAVEAAKKRALAAVESDPAVIAAAAALK